MPDDALGVNILSGQKKESQKGPFFVRFFFWGQLQLQLRLMI